MSKSKMPDLGEVGKMASKLFTDVKNSVCEIIADYKKERDEPAPQEKAPEVKKKKEKESEDKE